MFFNLAQASSLFFLFFYLLHFAFVVFVWVDMIKETKKGFLSILSHVSLAFVYFVTISRQNI